MKKRIIIRGSSLTCSILMSASLFQGCVSRNVPETVYGPPTDFSATQSASQMEDESPEDLYIPSADDSSAAATPKVEDNIPSTVNSSPSDDSSAEPVRKRKVKKNRSQKTYGPPPSRIRKWKLKKNGEKVISW